jgi:hypothetical protein
MINIFEDLVQGTDEWLAARCGLLTASEVKLIITPTLKIASNEKERTHLYELLAQRVTKYVEPHYISDDMLRGHEDEELARRLYAERYAPVREVGFITNDKWGFTLGCSPDGLVAADGMIECKSRRQKYQMEVVLADKVPDEHFLQVQAALLVSERMWLDYVSICCGLSMKVIRVYPDPKVQNAIVEAADAFEERLSDARAKYDLIMTDPVVRIVPVERRSEEDIAV